MIKRYCSISPRGYHSPICQCFGTDMDC